MARNDGVDRTVVRNNAYRRNGIALRERHNERKNESYSNPDIVPERSALNIHFKSPAGTYGQTLDRLLKKGIVSTRGLKADAKIFDEMVFDVNTRYFESHGGYEYAKEFFSEAYRCAIEMVGGEQYIISATMHADERNRGLSDELGRDVYHYHLHVIYLPVVEKEIRWSKRCKDPTLVGTIKERIAQISHSKKWHSLPMVDEKGKPVLNSKGKPVLQKSYSLMQDQFFAHMQKAGYTDLCRGEKGSQDQHLSVLEFKVEQEKERIKELSFEQLCEEERLSALRDQANSAASNLASIHRETTEAEERLKELTPQIEDTQQFLKKCCGPTEDILPEPDTFEGARKYRERKVVPLINRLQELVLSLYRKLQELKRDYFDLKRRFNRLSERCDDLWNENRDLHEAAVNYARTKRVLGEETVDRAVARAKDAEAAEAWAELYGRKPKKKEYER